MMKTLVIFTQRDPLFNIKIIMSFLKVTTCENVIIVFGKKSHSIPYIINQILIFGFFTCTKFFFMNLFLKKKLKNIFENISFIDVTDGNENLIKIIRNKKIEYYGVSLSFPFKIAPEILSIFDNKIINFHNSDLPNYRGLSPIFYQLNDKVKNFSFTIHFINNKIDHGRLIIQFFLLANKNLNSTTKILNAICKLQAEIVMMEGDKIFNYSHGIGIEHEGSYFSSPSLKSIISQKLFI